MQSFADTILEHGKIIIDPASEQVVEAIAIAGGKVVATGDSSSMARWRGSETRNVDLGGRTVIPGLIDSHLHFVRAGQSWLEELRISHVRTMHGLLELIRSKASNPSSAGWVAVVGGWHPGQLDEGRMPTREELDQASPNVPVYIQYGYVKAVLNSAAIRALDLDNVDHLGDDIERDEDGRATGTVFGKRAFGFCLKTALENDFEQKVLSAMQMYRDLNAWGMTGGIDTGGGARIGPEAYRVLVEVQRRGALNFKSRLYVHPHSHDNEFAELEEYLRQLHPGFGNDFIKYVGIGEIVLHDCYDGPGLDDFEIDETTKELLLEATMRCAELGWPVNIHAVKDSTLSVVLDVWEQVDRRYPLADRRFSISHADGASLKSLQRLHALGAGITVQDRLAIRTVDTAESWGDEAARSAPPLGDMLKIGVPLGGGTDATVAAPINPWLALQWFVTGRPIDGGPQRAVEHRLSRWQALDIYTRGSAWFSREEDQRGCLIPGYAADLAVLSEDYLAVPEDEIESIEAVLTLINGEAVYVNAGVFPGLNNERAE